MGRKKKEAEPEVTIEAPPLDADAIAHEHTALLASVDDLRAKRDFFQSNAGADVKHRIDTTFEERINHAVLGLEEIDKKDLEREQGRIAGLREAQQIVRGQAWDHLLEQAEARLAAFEEKNALFMQDGTPAPEDDEDVIFDAPVEVGE